MKKITFLLGALLLGTSIVTAQELEKTHKISGKAKRGNITNMSHNLGTGEIELKYVYSTTVNDEATYETYKYNNQFEQIDNEVKKGPIETFSKEIGSNYRGKKYTVKGVSIKDVLGITMAFKTTSTFTYSWKAGDYWCSKRKVSLKNSEKLIPNDAAGYVGHLTVENLDTESSLFVASLRDKTFSKKADHYKEYKHYRFLKIDKDLSVVNESKLDFEEMHTIAYKKAIYETTDNGLKPKLKGIAIVLAPVFKKKMTNKPADEWILVFIDADGNITKNIDFKVPSTKWDISDIVHNSSNDELYVYGPANKSVTRKGKMKYYQRFGFQVNSSTTIDGEKKYTMFQIMKAKEDSAIYVTNELIKEMAAKTYKLKGPSKKKIYKARKFETLGVNYMSNGDFMIYGSNYGHRDSTGTRYDYKEAITLHFGKNGGIKRIYSIKPYEKNYSKSPMVNTIVNDKEGKYMYWILQENAGVKSTLKKEAEEVRNGWKSSYSVSFVRKYKYLYYPRVIKVDLETATMKEYIPGKKKYFLDNKFPFTQTEEGDFIFFGSDKKERNIWFYKLGAK